MPKYPDTNYRDVEIEYEGDKITLQVRDLTFIETMNILEQSYVREYDPESRKFNQKYSPSLYWRKIISRSICTPPWNDEGELVKISRSWAMTLQGVLPAELFAAGAAAESEDPKELESDSDKSK